jgi:murein DD-endopeptidase MepM/ murein hydrolase activator NlpD
MKLIVKLIVKPIVLLLALAVPAQACIELSGEARQGALLWGQVAPDSRVFLNDEALIVSADGIVVFGFGRNETGDVLLRVEGEQACEQVLAIAGREYRIQRVEGVPQQTVTPEPEHMERIRRERELVRAAKDKSGARTYFAEGFSWPLQGPISGVYGSQRVYNGKPGNPHYGVDVAMPAGTPVAAPAAGVVVLAEPDLFYSGGTIIIDHGSQVSSSMLHLSEVSVAVGTRVKPGDTIGKVGSTGRATGPHLDWRMSWRNRRVDPQLLVPPMP